MIRRLPLVPTLIVAAAVAVMIGLGIWQLQRAGEKDALLARYSQAANLPPISYPTGPVADDQLPLFRHATGMCLKPTGKRTRPGQNRSGEPGFVQIVECRTGLEGPGMAVELGWSKNPNPQVTWPGGPVSGIIGPDQKMRMRLVAATAPAGLEPSASPSPASIPNNHRSYAVQWFLFAVIATVIYLLAVRQRQKRKQPPE